MSSLHDPRMRDPALLELACGLRSAIDRFDHLLARHAPPRLRPGYTDPDDLTLAVLGLIALRERLDRQLTGAADRAPTTAAGPAPVRLEGLLR